MFVLNEHRTIVSSSSLDWWRAWLLNGESCTCWKNTRSIYRSFNRTVIQLTSAMGSIDCISSINQSVWPEDSALDKGWIWSGGVREKAALRCGNCHRKLCWKIVWCTLNAHSIWLWKTTEGNLQLLSPRCCQCTVNQKVGSNQRKHSFIKQYYFNYTSLVLKLVDPHFTSRKLMRLKFR